jgi:threonine dehydrogenase-like Zn-dependent dehydrogenase
VPLGHITGSLPKAGTLSIVGVYPDASRTFPIGSAMNKNVTIRMENCNHRKYIPRLVELVQGRTVDPSKILTHAAPLMSALDAYKHFDKRDEGWIKVMLAAAAAA